MITFGHSTHRTVVAKTEEEALELAQGMVGMAISTALGCDSWCCYNDE